MGMINKRLKQVSPLTWVWVDDEKETINDKKQTSIDWLLKSSKQLYYDLHEGRIHQHEYHPKLKEIEAKAKQMHKEEMFEYIKQKYCIGQMSMEFHRLEFEQYYNETFG